MTRATGVQSPARMAGEVSVRVGICLSLLVAFTFGGCGENEPITQNAWSKAKAAQASEEHAEQRLELEAEVHLLSDASSAPQASEKQCKDLVVQVGQKMLAVTKNEP